MLTQNVSKTEYKFTSRSGFFRNVTGSVYLDKEAYIGVATNGDKGNVLVKYLTCNVEVLDLTDYLIEKKPFLKVEWRITYRTWSRGKGTYGVRDHRHVLDNDIVDSILGKETRLALQQELFLTLSKRLVEGLNALGEYLDTPENREIQESRNYNDQNNCKQCGENFYDAHSPICSLSDDYRKDM